MKILLYLLLFTISSISAQEKLLDILPMKNSKVTYSKVIEVKNRSKEQLNENLYHWMKLNNVNESVKETIDEKHDSFTFRGSTNLLWGPNDFKELYKDILFNINIITKNERFQYSISNFIIKDPGVEIQLEIFKMDQSRHKSYNRDFYHRLDTVVTETINSLQKEMSKI